MNWTVADPISRQPRGLQGKNACGRLGVVSDVGMVRELNEDYAAALELKVGGDGGSGSVAIMVVADGMGGHAAGEVASRTAVDLFVRTLLSELVYPGEAGFDPMGALEKGFETANRSVYDLGQQEVHNRGMGTTMTAGVLRDGLLCLGHVGDSRAYLIRDGCVRQLSKDHSVVQERLDAGLMTEEEAACSEDRNQLRRAVGIRSSVVCDIICEDLRDGDYLLLCTDGLHNTVHEADIVKATLRNSDPEGICRDLVGRALLQDGSDNTTALCLAVTSVPSSPPKPKAGVTRRSIRRTILFVLLMAVLLCIWLVINQITVTNRRGIPAVSESPGNTEVVARW